MEKLRALRKAQDLTMKQFGEIIGVSESTISLYENGKRQPDFTTLKKIADYFSVTIDYLLDRDNTSDMLLNPEKNMFSTRLKELRELRNLSQSAFAKDFGVAQSTVGGWESGAREPNYATTQKLADYFGVTVDYLLGRDNTAAAQQETPADSLQGLDPNESSLISYYRACSDDGKEKIREYARDRRRLDVIESAFPPSLLDTDKLNSDIARAIAHQSKRFGTDNDQ